MVGIVILDYNNATDTINCIESVIKYTQKGKYKLVVVENGSNTDTVNTISQYVKQCEDHLIGNDDSAYPTNLPFITLFNSRTNDGYAKGNNKGLSILDKDDSITHVMILNNDILFVEDIIGPLVNYSYKLKDCGLVSPMLLKKDKVSIDICCAHRDYTKVEIILNYLFTFKNVLGILTPFNRRHNMLVDNPSLAQKDFFEIEMPSGSCMLINKHIFKHMGFFDNNTFLYFEENILYKKSQMLGLKSYLVPKLKCIHLGASTTKKSKTSTFLMKNQFQSHEYYLKEYCNAPLLSYYVRIMSRLTLLKLHIQSVLINTDSNATEMLE